MHLYEGHKTRALLYQKEYSEMYALLTLSSGKWILLCEVAPILTRPAWIRWHQTVGIYLLSECLSSGCDLHVQRHPLRKTWSRLVTHSTQLRLIRLASPHNGCKRWCWPCVLLLQLLGEDLNLVAGLHLSAAQLTLMPQYISRSTQGTPSVSLRIFGWIDCVSEDWVIQPS